MLSYHQNKESKNGLRFCSSQLYKSSESKKQTNKPIIIKKDIKNSTIRYHIFYVPSCSSRSNLIIIHFLHHNTYSICKICIQKTIKNCARIYKSGLTPNKLKIEKIYISNRHSTKKNRQRTKT